METKQQNPKLIRWFEIFVCYDITIKYIKKKNINTNALNRKPNYKKIDKTIKPMSVKKITCK